MYNIHTDLKCIFYADLLYCRQPFFQKHLVLKTNYSELYTYTYNVVHVGICFTYIHRALVIRA